MNPDFNIIKELEQKYGDPFFILDMAEFEKNYHDLLGCFRDIYPNTHIAYSYKTNYTPKLCKYVKSQKGYAEVVSGMEYDIAVRIGIPAGRIIFNGPYKTERELEKSLIAGSIVNIDSVNEAEIIENIVRRYTGKKFNIGLRCAFEIEECEFTRFGVDANSPEFKSIIDKFRQIDNCNLIGIHCHFSTKTRSTTAYKEIADGMIEIYRKHFNENELQFIDIGGGFFGKMGDEIRNQFPYIVPTFEEYADVIAGRFAKEFPNSGPELIIEPGVSLTANIMKFVTKVISKKEFKGRKIASCSGSVYNIKPTMNKINLPVSVVKKVQNVNSIKDEILDIGGHTCREEDFLHKGYKGNMDIGDYLVFDNVGAYTLVLKPPFIQPGVAVVAIDKEGDFELAKREETAEDVLKAYEGP